MLFRSLECAVEKYPDLVLRKEDEGVWEKDPRSCVVGESDRDISESHCGPWLIYPLGIMWKNRVDNNNTAAF